MNNKEDKRSNTEPYIFIIDLDGTIIGDCNYQCDLYNQYPWGQLGYTYDWNPKNKSHVGLSEFIIGAGKTIYVNRIVTTQEYLR